MIFGKRPTRRQILIVGGVVAAVAVAQVGPAAAEDVYRFGALNPITGAGSTYGSGMQKAILFAVEEITAAGGAGGRQIEVVAEDSQTSPEAAVLAVKKLIEVNKVDAILGTWSSGVSLAILPIINAADRILMHTSAAPALSEHNDKHLAWRFQSNSEHIGEAFAAIATKEGFKRPAIMAFNNDAAIGNTDSFRRHWEEKGGKVTTSVVYEPKRTSYRSELQQVLSTSPDVIALSGYLPDTTIILREAYEFGAPVKFIIPAWAAGPQLVSALGPEVTEGVFVFDTVPNIDGAAFKRYDEKYRKATGHGGAENIYAAQTYDMAIVLGLALEKAGPGANNAAVVKAIREVSNPPGKPVTSFEEGKKLLRAGEKINYEGASGRLDFDDRGDITPDFGVTAIEKGKFVARYAVK
jgi:branched-chain amino acid transport system substrate-binding protein